MGSKIKTRVLDCECIDSIYQSLADITGIPLEGLNSFLSSFDIEAYYHSHPDCPLTGDDLMFEIIRDRYREPYPIDFTSWFHLTRASASNKFEEGILTLNEGIDSIWEFLFFLLKGEFNKEHWVDFRKKVETDMENYAAVMYRFKMKTPYANGPFATLIKELAFRTEETTYHDYLKAPEIVEDICVCFKETHGKDLLTKFIQNTKSCIVKFRVTGGKPNLIGTPLLYLYNTLHSRRMSPSCNRCFTGDGSRIPHESILKVEFLD